MSWFRSWKTILGLIVVFAAGVLFGVAGTAGVIKKEFARRMDSTTWTPRTLAWITEAGSLAPSQVDKIRPDVESAVADLVKLRTEADEQRKGILASMFADVLPKLDPPQREKLTQAVKQAAEKNQGTGVRGQGADFRSMSP
jgi:hypothetical protein